MVASSLADNLMRLVAEGAGEGDEEADAELRSRAAASYLQLLGKPKLPNILLKVLLRTPRPPFSRTHHGLAVGAPRLWQLSKSPPIWLEMLDCGCRRMRLLPLR